MKDDYNIKGLFMEHSEFYKIINLPEGVIEQLDEVQQTRCSEMPEEIRVKLFNRKTWADGIEELKLYLGEDPYSMKILWEQINLICTYSYEQYVKLGLSDKIFKDTFAFITRFVSSTKNEDGKYRYNLAWWLQRQITLQEFRIGSLEYEFVESDNNREIEIHIPSDADMNIKALCSSVADFINFEKKYFPDWCDTVITTETWMIMPELEQFLSKDSHIVKFKNLFDIDSVDYEQTWYMEWIFPGYSEINENLPEKTTLHKKLKSYLLSGKKFGIAKGHLVLERVYEVLK